jgi:hypothetical protein
VVRSTESDHFESEGLLSEVGRSAKADRQINLADRFYPFPWHNSMEAPDAGLEACPLDPQEVEGLSIDDVEAASAIHEYLGEVRVGDDGINNKRVDSWIRDVVRMVITVESDGHLRPVKEVGDRRLYGENLTPLSFVLACREVGRGSSVDHEAIMDLGEPPILIVALGIFLLVVLLDAYAFKVPTDHVTVLEVMVHGPLVVGTQLFEHFVEDAPAGGPSRFLAFSGGNKLVGRGLELALLVLLLFLVVPFRALAGTCGVIGLLLPFVLVTAKDCANCLLAGGKIGDDVHQSVGSEWGVTAQLSDQLFVGGSGEEGHNYVGVGDVGELGALPGETPDVIPEGFTRLLLATPEVP